MADLLARAAPEDVGFAPDLREKYEAGLRSGLLRDLHATVVLRGGRIALEAYAPGEDEAWGRPLGRVAHGPDSLHDLRSVTKSVVSLLYAIALERGLAPSPDAPLYEQFPEHRDLEDAARAKIRIEHALSMTLGLEWDERAPYTSAANSEVGMELADDRLRFVLERAVVAEPGARWNYCGGATALIGTLIARGAGKSLADFAEESLFAPLGVERFEWSRGRDGAASAASGLRLRARDLLRIGALVLGGGVIGEQRIVGADALQALFEPRADVDDYLRYGRFWYLRTPRRDAAGPSAPPAEPAWVAGFGNGGQRLYVAPEADLAAVIFSGAYNAPDARISPARVWREILLANLRAG